MRSRNYYILKCEIVNLVHSYISSVKQINPTELNIRNYLIKMYLLLRDFHSSLNVYSGMFL